MKQNAVTKYMMIVVAALGLTFASIVNAMPSPGESGGPPLDLFSLLGCPGLLADEYFQPIDSSLNLKTVKVGLVRGQLFNPLHVLERQANFAGQFRLGERKILPNNTWSDTVHPVMVTLSRLEYQSPLAQPAHKLLSEVNRYYLGERLAHLRTRPNLKIFNLESLIPNDRAMSSAAFLEGEPDYRHPRERGQSRSRRNKDLATELATFLDSQRPNHRDLHNTLALELWIYHNNRAPMTMDEMMSFIEATRIEVLPRLTLGQQLNLRVRVLVETPGNDQSELWTYTVDLAPLVRRR